MKRNIAIVLILILVALQFIHPKKNESTEILPSDITKVTAVPDDVLQVLKTACYDCHSNNTIYPWYNNIQPIAFWLQKHVNNGKEKLNFSEFGAYMPERKIKKLKEVVHEIEEGDMPLKSYTLIHRNAVLSDAQKQLVINWAKNAKF
ncbi:MAG TPA: heme-binding domain-containing protein [Chitinophagales bacterium]|nr:heme-binding domain-containing protein [Chitinophagales bacterium]